LAQRDAAGGAIHTISGGQGLILALNERQIVHRIEHHVARVMGARVIRNHFGGAARDHPIHKTFDPDFTVATLIECKHSTAVQRMGNRHRAVIAAIAHHGRRCDLAAAQIAGLKGRSGQRPHRGQVSSQPFPSADLVTAQDILSAFYDVGLPSNP
jgi:hypothetical protein